jgi:hypothetical protein
MDKKEKKLTNSHVLKKKDQTSRYFDDTIQLYY